MVYLVYFVVGVFRQKTAYVLRISDWSSDVCSSDLRRQNSVGQRVVRQETARILPMMGEAVVAFVGEAGDNRNELEKPQRKHNVGVVQHAAIESHIARKSVV